MGEAEDLGLWTSWPLLMSARAASVASSKAAPTGGPSSARATEQRLPHVCTGSAQAAHDTSSLCQRLQAESSANSAVQPPAG